MTWDEVQDPWASAEEDDFDAEVSTGHNPMKWSVEDSLYDAGHHQMYRELYSAARDLLDNPGDDLYDLRQAVAEIERQFGPKKAVDEEENDSTSRG